MSEPIENKDVDFDRYEQSKADEEYNEYLSEQLQETIWG